MIKGKLINLRLMEMRDIDAYVKAYNNLEQRGEFYPMNFLSVEKYKRDLAEQNCWKQDYGYMMITDNDDRVMGMMAFFKSSPYMEGFEVGYNIFASEDRGKGFGTEALKLFTAYMFEARNIQRLELNANPENMGSVKIAEKCGYQYEGRMRKAAFCRGGFEDLVKYSILKEDCSTLDEVFNNL